MATRSVTSGRSTDLWASTRQSAATGARGLRLQARRGGHQALPTDEYANCSLSVAVMLGP